MAESWIYQRIPALGALRGYSLRDLRGDVVGGLSVAAVAVPQSMAYALIVGLPPEYGLYTAIVMTLVGSLLDSSKLLVNGPTNAISIALLSAVGHLESPDARIQAAVVLGFLMGLIQISVSLLRLGDLTRYISHSVIVGFTVGASFLLVIDQTKNLLGLKAVGDVHDHFVVRFYRTMTEGGDVHLPTLAFGIGSVLAVLALRWVKAKLGLTLLPELLIVVAAAAFLTDHYALAERGVRVIGPIPASLPPFQVPNLHPQLVRELAPSALAIGLLGVLEAIAMAKNLAQATRTKLDTNQQVLSEGVANLVGSFFTAMPGSGSLTRSAINHQVGGRTQWAAVISAFGVAAIMFYFAPYAQHIPRSALAGILMLTALRMVNLHDLRFHLRASRFDAVIVGVTAISAAAISIEFCVLIGTFLSFLLAVPRTGQMHLTEFVVDVEGGVHERLADDHVEGELLIFGLEGEMFFGSGVSLDAHLDLIEARITPETRVLVLRVKRARNPDAVGMALLEGMLQRMRERGVRVLLCGVRADMLGTMERCGLRQKLDAEQIFEEQSVRQTSTMLAIKAAYTLLGRDRELGKFVI